MRSIVTAVYDDGAKWGWPGETVYRYRGEDGTWAWVPQPPGRLHDVGDIIDEGDESGWEWLSARERKSKLAELSKKSAQQRKIDLIRIAEKHDKLDLRERKKTGAELQREINEFLGVTKRPKRR